jgi:hypothetical protein
VPEGGRAYPKRSDAQRALSRAAVRFGRRAAGLPPLEIGPWMAWACRQVFGPPG